MLKIVIQNPSCETVINNVFPDELDFWKNLLEGTVCGEVKVLDQVSGYEALIAQKV
jgi:hypothetical protein